MKSILFSVLTAILAASACARDPSPTAPDSPQLGLRSTIASATIKGQVYAELGWAEPAIPDALVRIKEDGGSEQIVSTDADGFYKASARAGAVTITASKEGHQPQTQQFTLSGDTVLNFGLDPM